MQRKKDTAGKIINVTPRAAIEGGEVFIECENVPVSSGNHVRCFFGKVEAHVTAGSSRRVIAAAPRYMPDSGAGATEIKLFCHPEYSENGFEITTGSRLAEDLHIVANPAYDADENCLIVTRSGSRGQQLPVTLFRLRILSEINRASSGKPREVFTGEIEEISGDVMNPTGIAFSPSGEMFVTSRGEGTVYRVTRADEVVPFAYDLGIATGIAFDRRGEMYVGDRAGTIHKINSLGGTEVFATLEQSIAAYHLAFGLDGALYVTRPNVASFDSVMRIDENGEVSTFYRGLGRPQGLAFDRDGNLYVAACLRQRRGIVRITPDGKNAELFVAGMNIVGLCFGKRGEMFVATNEAVFQLDLGIYGTLL